MIRSIFLWIFSNKAHLIFWSSYGFISTPESWNLAGWSIFIPRTPPDSGHIHILKSLICHYTLSTIESRHCVKGAYFSLISNHLPQNLIIANYKDKAIALTILWRPIRNSPGQQWRGVATVFHSNFFDNFMKGMGYPVTSFCG